MIKGSIVAIVTPMNADGSLDLPAFRSLIDFHIEQGTDAIVVVGTSGESPTVDVNEHELLIQVAVDHAAKRIPVIAGTGANSTKEAIELAAFSRKAGADASLMQKKSWCKHEKNRSSGNAKYRKVYIIQPFNWSRLACRQLAGHNS